MFDNLLNKKGMELSLTVLVLIILSILIFIGSVVLVWKFFAGAEDIKTAIDVQTQEQIQSLLRSSNDLVALPFNTKTIDIGKEATFALGIRNLEDERDFHVWLDFDDMYDTSGKRVGVAYDAEYINARWLGAFQQSEPVTIKKHQYDIIPIRIRTAATIAEGQPTPPNVIAAFNVCVSEQLPETVGPCTLDMPVEQLHGNKIRQVYIQTK